MSLPALTIALGSATVIAGLWLTAAGWLGWGPAGPSARQSSRTRRLRATLTSRAFARQALACLTCGLAVLALTRWPVAALAAAVGAVAVPRIVSSRTATQRINRLEALEQWTRRLSDLLTAGRGLEQAIGLSATRNVPDPIAVPVQTLARRLTTAAMPAEQALRLFADELDDPVADRIAAALILVARRRGAGASSVLNGLADLVARDVTDRREVEAARAEHRTTVRWVIGILLLLTTAAVLQRSYVAPFATPLGQAVLAVIVAFYAAAFWWLHRLGSPVAAKRFLTGRPAERQEAT